MSVFSKIAAWFRRGKKINDPPHIPDLGDEGTDGEGENAPVNTSGITSFSYSYIGSIGGGSYTYSVNAAETGAATLTVEHMEHRDYGELTGELPDGFLTELYRIYKECHIAAWNGFNKYNPHVCDGDGFSLSIGFVDKKSVSAHGSNSFPRGYRNFCEQMEALFKPEVEKLFEKARQQRIAQGLDAELDSIFAFFKQRGTSGADEYDIMLYKKGVRSCNFDLKIKSVSGEFFPKGTKRYFCEVPNEALDYAGFDAICKKYDVIQWYDYDKTAKDYNNSEWFQLSLGFGGTYVNACGTEHPAGYDGFRQEFLGHLREVVDNAVANYGVTEYV